MSLKACIIGNGAIGSLLAAKCQQRQLPYEMWWRQYKTTPLTVTLLNGEKIKLCATKPQPTDFLVIATKAWQVQGVLQQYYDYLTPQSCILLLHNGAGTEEQVLKTLPNNPVLRMTTSQAALKLNDNEITETGFGTSQAGWLRAPEGTQKTVIENWCNQVMADCEWFVDIRLPIWQKLAINCVINPLTAIHNIKNGVLSHPQFQMDIKVLLKEFFTVSEAEQIPLDKGKITQQVMTVINKTAENYSSMHQDVAMGRKTEIDFINGYLLSCAAKRNIPLPLNQKLVSAISTLHLK